MVHHAEIITLKEYTIVLYKLLYLGKRQQKIL